MGTNAPERVEDDIRTAVADHLQPELRLYRRLWLAKVDLEEALATVDEILRARILIPRRDRPPPLLMALTTAMVVAYSRPWVHSRGQSAAERTVPASLLRCLTSRQRQAHEYLIELRNREIAHSDADVADLHLRLFLDGESAIVWSAREAFRRAELLDIRRIIVKLQDAIEKRCSELRTVLPNHQWI
jgi:hypothetical protein